MTSAELLADLRREIVARGWNRKTTGRIVFELLIHVTMSLTGIAVFIFSDNWVASVCGLILMALGNMGVGTNTHTSSHNATSDKQWVNELLTYFGYSFFSGVSANWWWNNHVAVHHSAPNVMGVDYDADLWPWFAMTEEEARRVSGWRRWYYERLQWLVFPIVVAGHSFNFVKSSWVFLIRALRDPQRRNRKHWFDLTALLLHLTVYLAVPMFFFAPRDVIGFYLLRALLMSYAMFAVLAPAHFPPEAARLSADQKDADYLLLQTATIVNFRTGWIGRLLVSGLDYQIEHHLFPNLSHVHYRKLGKLVAEKCRENGLPYRMFHWDRVILTSWTVLRTPQPVVTDVETLRLPPGKKLAESLAQ